MARVADHLSVEDLEAEVRSARDPTATRHFQVIWLLGRGHTIADVAAVTSFGPRWIEQLLARYNAHGPEALGDLRRRNGGVPSVLHPALLERLRARLEAPPPDGGLWSSRKVAACGPAAKWRPVVQPQSGGLWSSRKVAACVPAAKWRPVVQPQSGGLDGELDGGRTRARGGVAPTRLGGPEGDRLVRAETPPPPPCLGHARGAGPAPGHGSRGLGDRRAPHRAEADPAPGVGAQRPAAHRAGSPPL